MADGTVISSMNKMLKNNSGYDLKQLFIGSEGTLGIVTKVVLQLQPAAIATHTALLSLQSYNQVLQVFRALKAGFSSGLTTFELMWHDYVAGVIATSSDLANPLADAPLYLLVEVTSSNSEQSLLQFEESLFALHQDSIVCEALVAQSGREAQQFWRIREGVSELLADYPDRSNQDVSLPIADIGPFTDRLQKDLAATFADLKLFLFGHIGDGNVHIIAATTNPQDCPALTEMIMQRVRDFGGAISAEHGVGVLKKDFLDYSRTSEEIELMRTLKRTLDPNNILNPGRIFELHHNPG